MRAKGVEGLEKAPGRRRVPGRGRPGAIPLVALGGSRVRRGDRSAGPLRGAKAAACGGQPPLPRGISGKKEARGPEAAARPPTVPRRDQCRVRSQRRGRPYLAAGRYRAAFVDAGPTPCGGGRFAAGARDASEPGDAFGQQREKSFGVDIAHEHRVRGTVADAPPVSDGHAQGEFALRLDLDVDVAPGEEVGLEQVGDHAGIMQRRALASVFRDVEPLEEIGPRRHHAAHARAHRAERLDPAPSSSAPCG